MHDLLIHTFRFLKELQHTTLPRTRFSILNLSTLIFSFYIICRFTPVQMYHLIRHQSLIRLYVIFNFLDICERLVETLLNDISEALLKKIHITYFIVHLIFTTIQAFISYIYFAALHVTINSHSDKLYALLLGVNFYEVRSVVFKRYTVDTLNELYESDLMKRFSTILFLVLIYFLDLRENYDNTCSFVFSIIVYYVTKVGVDWLKHTYIWRYNEIKEHRYVAKIKTNYVPLIVVVMTVMGYIYRKRIPCLGLGLFKNYKII